jgi:predicted PurR-regulated permease PerM
MGLLGFMLGVPAFVFAMSALGKISKLEKQLKEAGVLRENYESD